MKIKGTQEVIVDIDVIDFINQLQVKLVGCKYTSFNENDGEYYIKYKDDTQIDPWIRRSISELQYKSLKGLEDAIECYCSQNEF